MMNPKIDAYIERSEMWPAEMRTLRPILLECGLEEALKWGKPCYSHDGANIVIMQEMKGFLSLMFFKGGLLEDPAEVLHSQGPNSRSAMRMQFTSADEVTGMTGTIRDYVEEAVDVEKAGLEVGPAPEPEWVEELQVRLDEDPELRAAFEALTPGRRREYNLHFSEAKQSKTRQARVEKHVPRILEGKGFRDR
jgi:uncharacterized protein YdeI (YjbR/CyaY-like superfamily)